MELVIPDRLAPSALFTELVQAALDWITAGTTPTLAPEGTVDSFNHYLKLAWAGKSGRAPTSYTFRRAAFRRFIEGCRNREGVVSWSHVAKYSLHFDERTVRAFYHLGAGRACRTEEV